MITDKLRAIIDALAPDVPATVDPRDVNPPAAWIGGTAVESIALTGEVMTISTDVVLISQPAGGESDYKTLDSMLNTAVPALIRAGATIDYVDLEASATLPDGGGNLPAYRLHVII